MLKDYAGIKEATFSAYKMRRCVKRWKLTNDISKFTDENEVRLNLNPSEAVAVANYFEEKERVEAKTRMLAGKPSEDSSGGETRQKVAKKTGYSFDTIKKAKAIVEAAEKEPEISMGQGKRTDLTSGKFPEVHRTRDALGKFVGVSGKTLEKAEAVVKAAEEEPEKYLKLQNEMKNYDSSYKVCF